MHTVVSFVGYFLVTLIAIVVAANWVWRNHPAMRDINALRHDLDSEAPRRPAP